MQQYFSDVNAHSAEAELRCIDVSERPCTGCPTYAPRGPRRTPFAGVQAYVGVSGSPWICSLAGVKRRASTGNVLILDSDVPAGKRPCLPRMNLDMNLTTLKEPGDFTEILIDADERIEEELLQRISKGR